LLVEGSWAARKAAAARAYHEWLPTRPKKDLLDFYRSFQFGELSRQPRALA
jgi:alkaline phosphatase D